MRPIVPGLVAGLFCLFGTVSLQAEAGLQDAILVSNDYQPFEQEAVIVEFHIPDGTGAGPWNQRDDIIEVRVGDTLRIVNDDVTVHALHTSGAPCPHSPDIAQGEFYDCVISRPYDVNSRGPLFDHYAGPRQSAFWVNASH